MKKILSVFLAVLMFFMLVSCSKKGKNEEHEATKVENQNDAVNTTKEKTYLDKLCDFIAENGVYEEENGNYNYVEGLWEDKESVAYLSLICDVNNKVTVIFCNKQELPYELSVDTDDREEIISLSTLELEQSNSSLPVCYFRSEETPYVNSYFTGNSLYIEATGEISPEQVSSDNIKVHNIDFSYDSSMSFTYSEIKAKVNKLFSPNIEVLISCFDIVLEQYTDISIKDLGFTKW